MDVMEKTASKKRLIDADKLLEIYKNGFRNFRQKKMKGIDVE